MKQFECVIVSQHADKNYDEMDETFNLKLKKTTDKTLKQDNHG